MYCTVIHCMAYEEDSFIAELSSSQSEYLTHWEKILYFLWIYNITKCYICLNPSQWYFVIIYAFMMV
jgi:hypothetical protein